MTARHGDGGASFVLDYPPSGNAYKRHYCTVGPRHRVSAYLTKESVGYKLNVREKAEQMGIQPLSGPVRLVVDVYRPRAVGDADNTLKLLQDSLEGVAYDNDRQVRELHVYLHDDDKSNPRVEVKVERIL